MTARFKIIIVQFSIPHGLPVDMRGNPAWQVFGDIAHFFAKGLGKFRACCIRAGVCFHRFFRVEVVGSFGIGHHDLSVESRQAKILLDSVPITLKVDTVRNATCSRDFAQFFNLFVRVKIGDVIPRFIVNFNTHFCFLSIG
nr:MAG TPA: hypothetical protein [Caudoviricetes sp.]